MGGLLIKTIVQWRMRRLTTERSINSGRLEASIRADRMRRAILSIAGIRGAVLRVGVQKEGYYMIDGKSAGAFAYGIRSDSSSKDPPVADRPAVFVLQKMGVTEPLVRISDYHRIERDGSPMEISLLTGKPVLAGKGQLRIEAWTQDQIVDSEGHYDWKCRISVPGGGLVERKGQFDFEAPIDGYKSSMKLRCRGQSSIGGPNRDANTF